MEDYAFKVWLKRSGRSVIGKGGAAILEAIQELGSISKAAKALGMSYRYVWNYLAEAERAIGRPVVVTGKGGRRGGGWAKLTEEGKALLKEYRRVEQYLSKVLNDREYWEAVGLKISARNKIEGVIREVSEGLVTATVKVEVDRPVVITALITKEAARELGLKPGDKVKAVIKATEVLIAKE